MTLTRIATGYLAAKTSGVHPLRWIVWEGEPAAASVVGLEAAGVRSLVFDPCGNTPEGGDYMGVMETNAAALERAFAD